MEHYVAPQTDPLPGGDGFAQYISCNSDECDGANLATGGSAPRAPDCVCWVWDHRCDRRTSPPLPSTFSFFQAAFLILSMFVPSLSWQTIVVWRISKHTFQDTFETQRTFVRFIPHSRTHTTHHTHGPFLSFPYVCPEPVLVKCS
eukprot:COSAG06_NODE_24022_length_675_cov_0.777778_1_plen_144_part_10